MNHEHFMPEIRPNRVDYKYNAIEIISKPFRDEISKMFAELAVGYMDFGKKLKGSEELVVSTKWFKRHIKEILDKIDSLELIYQSLEGERSTTILPEVATDLKRNIINTLYDDYCNQNVIIINREYINNVCLLIAVWMNGINLAPEINNNEDTKLENM